jgi:hypothetical protein
MSTGFRADGDRVTAPKQVVEIFMKRSAKTGGGILASGGVIVPDAS